MQKTPRWRSSLPPSRRNSRPARAEITYGFSEKTSQGSRQELDAIYQRMNG